MDEAMKMMTEYILEENVSQKTEIRNLKEENGRLKSDNDYVRDSLGRSISERSKLYNVLSQYAKWENGKLQYISIYNEDALQTICNILGLCENDKATL